MILLIVEDEDIIRQGLIVTIQKLQFRFDHIYEARDGIDGLSMCAEYMPDIIMTDIRMPRMDGLSFISQAKDLVPDGRFIILSGYSDFDYARTAIQYGVKEYLLKPSSKSEIQKTLSRITSEIERERDDLQKLNQQMNNYVKKLDQFQQLLLGDILTGRYPTDQILPVLSHYSIEPSPKGFLVLCYCILPTGDSDCSSTDYKQHEDWVCTMLSDYFDLFPTDILSSSHCLIISPVPDNESSLESLFHEIKKRTAVYQTAERIRLCFAFSPLQTDVKRLPDLYTEASRLLFKHFFCQDAVLLFSGSQTESPENIVIPGAMLDSLYHAFLSESRFDLRQSFLNLLRYLSESANGSPDRFASAMDQVAHYLTTLLIQDNHMPETLILPDFAVWDSFSLSRDCDELYHNLLSQLFKYREKIRGRHEDTVKNIHSPIGQALTYIDQNYYKDMDLVSISRLVSMNSSYFSSLFKKKTGLSFSTYLQNVRLEKSKILLLNSNRKLYEISSSVGISNVKYFCKLFKSYTGMTPSEFKKAGTPDGSIP